MKFKLSSTAFNPGERIDELHTADGQDLSPPLTWTPPPEPTRQLALICDDPDAPTTEPWVHWVAYNIPSEMHSLPAAIRNEPRPAELGGVLQGRNSFRNGSSIGYRGPAPPPGHGVHRYHFQLYALDAKLDLQPGLSKEELLKSIQGHILAQAELVGTYNR